MRIRYGMDDEASDLVWPGEDALPPAPEGQIQNPRAVSVVRELIQHVQVLGTMWERAIEQMQIGDVEGAMYRTQTALSERARAIMERFRELVQLEPKARRVRAVWQTTLGTIQRLGTRSLNTLDLQANLWVDLEDALTNLLGDLR